MPMFQSQTERTSAGPGDTRLGEELREEQEMGWKTAPVRFCSFLFGIWGGVGTNEASAAATLEWTSSLGWRRARAGGPDAKGND
jgi:hypothetical protein